MKKLLTIALSTAIVLSLSVTATYAAKADKKEVKKAANAAKVEQKVKEEPKVEAAESVEKVEVTKATTPETAQPEVIAPEANAPEDAKKDDTKDQVKDQLKDKIEALKEQFKEQRKNKEARKEILKEMIQLRREKNDESIPVFINGNEVEADVPPVIKEGRTLIPVRAITKGLGADVNWDEETSTATITKTVTSEVYGEQQVTIVMNLKTNIITVNGEEVTLDVPAQVVNNRTMVPLRFIAEVFNQNVEFDEELSTVVIDEQDGEEKNAEKGKKNSEGKKNKGKN